MAGQQNTVEVRSPNNWQFKAAFGTAMIIGIVILAWMYRWHAGVGVTIIGVYVVGRLWIAVKRQHGLNQNEAKTLRVGMLQLETTVDRGTTEVDILRAELQRALIAARLHHFPGVGVLFFQSDGSYELIPPTVSERKKIAALAESNEAKMEFKPQLIPVMTQPGIVYVISGAQRSGKSWQAGHIADHWLSFGITPIVIGTKSDNPGYDWAGCKMAITDNKRVLTMALKKIMKDSRERHGLLKAERQPQPVILDDWMATLRLVPKLAYEFMSMAAVTMASAKIVVYIIMQSDTVNAFGLKQLGATLKNNFMRLNVIPIPGADGRITPGHSCGKLIYPNTKDAIPVGLMPGRPGCFPDPGVAMIGTSTPISVKPPAVPVELSEDDKIKQLIADSKTNYAICKTLGWKPGGSKYERIKAIRAETNAQ